MQYFSFLKIGILDINRIVGKFGNIVVRGVDDQ